MQFTRNVRPELPVAPQLAVLVCLKIAEAQR